MMNLFENLQKLHEAKNFDLDKLLDAARNEANDINYSNAREDVIMCREQLEAMADGGNDSYVDAVCEFIIQNYDFTEDQVDDYREEIEKAVIEYSKETLSDFEWIFSGYIEMQEDEYYNHFNKYEDEDYDDEEDDEEEDEDFGDYDPNNFIWDGKSKVPKNVVNVTIQDGVTDIIDEAFWDYNSLKSIKIPDSITKIGEAAFRWCNSLQSIEIPNSNCKISKYAFDNCDSLKEIKIGNEIMTLEEFKEKY